MSKIEYEVVMVNQNTIDFLRKACYSDFMTIRREELQDFIVFN